MENMHGVVMIMVKHMLRFIKSAFHKVITEEKVFNYFNILSCREEGEWYVGEAIKVEVVVKYLQERK
jgi:hypothetical protein